MSYSRAPLVGILAASGIVALLASRPVHHRRLSNGGCCQLCECNGGVVPCQIDGTTCPAGQTCAMCNGPDGSIIPCLTVA